MTKQLIDFTQNINLEPLKSEVLSNIMANNSLYIPIGTVMNKLDEVYQGLWKTSNFKTERIENEIVGTLILEVFHPVSQCWISRVGSASVMIQYGKGTEIKIKNTLVKDYPHLMSECIKSACKTLGASFGRNLNKDFVEKYQAPDNEDEVKAMTDTIMGCTTKAEVIEISKNLNGLSENKHVKKIINLRITQLKC
jgi:hypothetical protein